MISPFIRWAFALSGISLAFQVSLRADELDQIQRERESAQMKYLRELSSGNYRSAQQKEELRHQLLDPPEQKARAYFKKLSQDTSPRKVAASELSLPKLDSKELAAYEKDLSNSANATASSEGSHLAGRSDSSSTGVPASEKAPIRPEFVLDGSRVPKEIEFKHENRAPAAENKALGVAPLSGKY